MGRGKDSMSSARLPCGLYDSGMTLDDVFSPGTTIVVGVTVFATVSLRALSAGPRRRTGHVAIEWGFSDGI